MCFHVGSGIPILLPLSVSGHGGGRKIFILSSWGGGVRKKEFFVNIK